MQQPDNQPGRPVLKIDSLLRSFGDFVGVDVPAFAMQPGEHVALAGESGSGKTTFLNLIAGILKADRGSILIAGDEMNVPAEPARDRLRATHIGYVFQTFNLLQGYTAIENVELGMMFGDGIDRDRAADLLKRVGLSERLDHKPAQMSVGQQQRVAIARALANSPKIVLADEPTGNLDSRSTAEVLDLMHEVCRDAGAALLLVSHDQRVLDRFDTVVAFADINRAAAAQAGGDA